MPDPEDPPLIVLKLRPLKSDVPQGVRLRRLLKFALRACQFRNEGVSEEKPKPKEEATNGPGL